MKHGKIYEPLAREKYENILKDHLRRDVSVRETVVVVQPNLIWLAASPDGLISDTLKEAPHVGLSEIKCPSKKEQ